MAVTVDSSSVSIEVHEPNACFPDAQIVRDRTGAPGAKFFIFDSKARSHGIWIKGDANFVLGPGDSLSGWKLGFVQIVRMKAFTVRYSGRIGSEGSIVIDPMLSLSTNVLLDCFVAANIPWSSPNPPTGNEFKGTSGHATTQDNPNQAVPATLQNQQVSKIDNFLYDFKQECEFWTILTAMDPAKTLHFLAHTHWEFVHRVDFFWRTGDPMASEWGTFKILDKTVLGPPTEAVLQPILRNPVGPIANEKFKNAIASGFASPSTPIRNESANGLSPRRMDFWRATELPANVA